MQLSAAVCISIALVLLVGIRLDAQFAGGGGLGVHNDAHLVDIHHITESTEQLPQSVQRGQIVTTNEATFAHYTINDTCIFFMAENTQVLFFDGRTNNEAITLLTGRITTKGACTVHVAKTTWKPTSNSTFIFFSWKDELIVHDEITTRGVTGLTQESPTITENIPYTKDATPLIAEFTTWTMGE